MPWASRISKAIDARAPQLRAIRSQSRDNTVNASDSASELPVYATKPAAGTRGARPFRRPRCGDGDGLAGGRIMRYKNHHRTSVRACSGRRCARVPADLMPAGRARKPDAAVRARHKSAAVVAVASVVAGALALRSLRAAGNARARTGIRTAEMAAAPRGTAEAASPGPAGLRVLLDRISDNFATGYQTMTAIIQGVALVVLITASAHAIFGTASGSRIAAAASQAVAVFVIIIVTTDQFFQLAATTRWLPTTFDTAIPYLIGAGEATAALSLGDNTRWWAGISWSLLAGAIAFAHSALRARPEGFEGIENYYRHFVRDVRRSANICAALCAYAAALAVTSALAHLPPWLSIAAPWAVTAAAIIRVGHLRWGGVPAADA